MGPPIKRFASCLPAYQAETEYPTLSFIIKKREFTKPKALRNQGVTTELAKQYPLYITTTKNTTAVDMTSHFGIDHFFDGTVVLASSCTRQDVIRQALTTHTPDPETVVGALSLI